MKAVEMKIVYMILALILLIWAILFMKGLRSSGMDILKGVFG